MEVPDVYGMSKLQCQCERSRRFNTVIEHSFKQIPRFGLNVQPLQLCELGMDIHFNLIFMSMNSLNSNTLKALMATIMY